MPSAHWQEWVILEATGAIQSVSADPGFYQAVIHAQGSPARDEPPIPVDVLKARRSIRRELQQIALRSASGKDTKLIQSRQDGLNAAGRVVLEPQTRTRQQR